MSDPVLITVIGGVFGLLVELLRRTSSRTAGDSKAHALMAEQLTTLIKDVGGIRADVRALSGRVDHLDTRLDHHLEGGSQ